MVVPKAALYQTQTFYAKGKGKQIQQLVSNLRGEPLAQGKSQSWEGKLLKIPPVSPSILDCPIIRVEYALEVSSGRVCQVRPFGKTRTEARLCPSAASAGVRGRPRRPEPVPVAAAGHRHHPSARLRHANVQHQQQLQRSELAGPVRQTGGCVPPAAGTSPPRSTQTDAVSHLFVFIMQLRPTTTTSPYQTLTGGNVCRPMMGRTARERRRGQC